MIDCRETLAKLYEYLDDELSPEQAAQVAEHLEACRHCFDRAEFERSFGSFVKQAGQEKVDADPLKTRIKARLTEIEAAGEDEELFLKHEDNAPIDDVEPPATHLTEDELRRMRAFYRRHDTASDKATADEPPAGSQQNPGDASSIPFWSFLLAAAAVVLIAVPFIRQYGTRSGPDPMIDALLALHTDSQPQIEETDPAALTQWVAQRTSIDPMIRGLADIGCTLKGAAVDSVWGTQLVHVYAESDGQPLSMIVTTQKEFMMPRDLGVIQLDDERYWTATAHGYSLLFWKIHDSGLVCVAIAHMPASDLTHLMQEMEEAELTAA